MFFRLRLWLEHQGTDDTQRLTLNGWQGALLSPHDAWHHWEHHRYPTVPYHRLARARQLLRGPAVLTLRDLVSDFAGMKPIASGTPLKVVFETQPSKWRSRAPHDGKRRREMIQTLSPADQRPIDASEATAGCRPSPLSSRLRGQRTVRRFVAGAIWPITSRAAIRSDGQRFARDLTLVVGCVDPTCTLGSCIALAVSKIFRQTLGGPFRFPEHRPARFRNCLKEIP